MALFGIHIAKIYVLAEDHEAWLRPDQAEQREVLNRNSERIPRRLAAGLASESKKQIETPYGRRFPASLSKRSGNPATRGCRVFNAVGGRKSNGD